MVYRGDRREIAVSLTADSQNIDIDEIECVQFVFGEGDFEYFYPGENVTYDEDTEKFIITLEQRDTFSLTYEFSCQARVKFRNGYIFASQRENLTLGQIATEKEI